MNDFFAPLASESLSVGALTRRVKGLLEAAPDLAHVRVVGELSNFKRHASGHCYFSLKDSEATLSAVMYRGAMAKNPVQDFAEGDRVEARGAVTVYEARGQYQLLVSRMMPHGVGELYKRFVRLKENLAAEGLFDEARKRPLPELPRAIAIVTSPTGAVVHDVIRTLRRRGARLRLYVLPSLVQGPEAVPQLLGALALAAQLPVDAVLLARGGGSMEDLWCFNDERLARAVAAHPVPVVSAIGHETDFCIADFVADLRASTPTAAAELLAPPLDELEAELAYYDGTLRQHLHHLLHTERLGLDDRQARLEHAAQAALTQARRACADASAALQGAAAQAVAAQQGTLAQLAASLDALNPAAVLARGFARVETPEGTWLRSAADLTPGRRLRLHLADGTRPATAD